MTAAILRLRSVRLSGGAAPEVIGALSCGCEQPFRLGGAKVQLLGATVRCRNAHGACACGMPGRPGTHSADLCGLADGSKGAP